MSAPLLAITATFCFGLSHVTAKRGLMQINVSSGLLLSLGAALVVVAGFVLADPPEAVTPDGFALFAVGGLLAPGLSRWASTTGIDRLGPAIAIPVQSGTRPLLSVVGAVIFLHESVTAPQVLGLVAIVGGGWYVSRARTDLVAPLGDSSSGQGVGFRPAVLYSMLAALCYATSDVVVKHALDQVPDPGLGAAVATGTALLAWSVASVGVGKIRRRLHFNRTGATWLGLSGVLTGLAVISLFGALAETAVTLVIPVLASQPLIVMLLSRGLLRDVEAISTRIVLAAAAIVTGTTLVLLG